MSDNSNFSDLLEQSLDVQGSFEGKVVKGTVIRVQGDVVIVDVGLKSEGRVPQKEFDAAGLTEVRPGDVIDVFVERLEDKNGGILLSIERARKEAAWDELGKAFTNETVVEGSICGRIKGGFAVDMNGAIAFLPGSQVDIRPVGDITPLMNIKQPFKIIKMDKARSNIVVSRRAVIEDSMAGTREEVIASLSEGKIIKGVVKNITEYGAFVDLGGIDGLLHATDMSWKRISHPSEVVSVGQTVEVQVLKFNPETQRISLGLKQLQFNPWDGIEKRYVVGEKYKGVVTNVAEYGAFVELEQGIEGLVYISEISWLRKNVNIHKIVTQGQEVEVMILDVDAEKRRMSLGLKQCYENPWREFAQEHPVGSVVEGVVRNATEFGLFVGLTDQLDGMVHMNDISWDERGEEAIKAYTKGQKVSVKIMDIDPDKERISVGLKQVDDSFDATFSGLHKGDVITCTVKEINDRGLEVTVQDKITAFIKKIDLSSDRSRQRPDLFAVGERVDAKITMLDMSNHRLGLSIRAREVQEEKQALSEYGSADSGASLGDILGEAIRKKQEENPS